MSSQEASYEAASPTGMVASLFNPTLVYSNCFWSTCSRHWERSDGSDCQPLFDYSGHGLDIFGGSKYDKVTLVLALNATKHNIINLSISGGGETEMEMALHLWAEQEIP